MKTICFYMIRPGIYFSCFFLVYIFSVGCSSMKVTWDYDKHADFKKYTTYKFVQSIDHSRIKAVSKTYILTAVAREMEARCCRKSNSLVSDIWIDLFMAFDKNIRTSETNDQIIGMQRYRYGGGFSNSFVDQHVFVEGTLVIDIIDGKTNEIVWEGRVRTAIRDELPETEKEKIIDAAVSRVFEKYPVAASVSPAHNASRKQ